jgi:hypothetical protein
MPKELWPGSGQGFGVPVMARRLNEFRFDDGGKAVNDKLRSTLRTADSRAI